MHMGQFSGSSKSPSFWHVILICGFWYQSWLNTHPFWQPKCNSVPTKTAGLTPKKNQIDDVKEIWIIFVKFKASNNGCGSCWGQWGCQGRWDQWGTKKSLVRTSESSRYWVQLYFDILKTIDFGVESWNIMLNFSIFSSVTYSWCYFFDNWSKKLKCAFSNSSIN